MFSPELILVLFLILAAEFVNGWTDAPNSIATVISTRALSPIRAVFFANSSRLKTETTFGKLQLFSAGFMAFSHGSNDGQKFIGVFALALLLAGVIPSFQIPLWVILICALTMGIGTALGGWRIMKTLGMRLTKLRPSQGFSAETAAALTIQTASHFGIPLSTTHTISTAIMGVGSARRISAVKWGVGRNIVFAWILTFPICGIFAFLLTKIILFLF